MTNEVYGPPNLTGLQLPFYVEPTTGDVGINTLNPTRLFQINARDASEFMVRFINPLNSNPNFDFYCESDGAGRFQVKNASGTAIVQIAAISNSFINNTTGLSIGSSSATASALLSVQSVTKGFLPPVMTTTEKNAISSPATGLVVFDSTLGKLCVYSGGWQTVTSV